MVQLYLLQCQPDSPLLRLRRQNCDTIIQRLMKVKRLLHHCRSSALELADLKNVIHQRQQMLRRHTDFLAACFLLLHVLLPFLHNCQHSKNPVNGRAQVMGHMGKEFALCRVRTSHLFEQLHNRLLLFFPCHHSLRDILMVTVETETRFFECLVRHTAAAHVYFAQRRMFPRINHFGTPCFQHVCHGFLHHLHIIRHDVVKPMLIALFRVNPVRYAQQNTHGAVGIHPWPAALLELNRPDSGTRSLKNVLKTLSCFELILFFLLHHGIDIALGKNDTVVFLRDGKMHLHMFKSGHIVLDLIAYKKLFLFSKLRKHIVFFRRRAEQFLISGNHILGYILLHCRLIAVFKTAAPVHTRPVAVPIDFALACVEIHLIDVEIVDTEGMENIVASLLQLAKQIAPFQRGHNKIRRSLEHIGRVFEHLCRRIVHTVKADELCAVTKRNHHKGTDILALQGLILKGVCLPNIFQTFDDNMFANTKLPIPACTYLRGKILKILYFRLHSACRPLIGVVVTAGRVLFKYIGSLPVQRFSQMLKQHCQRLIRCLLQERDTKPFINDGLQILNALYTMIMLTCPIGRSIFAGLFKKLP